MIAWIVSRALRATERRLAERRGVAGLDASGQTRLRFIRRLVFAAIIALGVFAALIQFDSLDRIASAALASGALLTAILGFAARESLANLVGGVTIAITQPIRVGDRISVADVAGIVEDVTLTYTWVRTADGGHIAVPNEVLTTTPLRNDSIGEHVVEPSATVWITGDADEAAAIALLGNGTDVVRATVDDTAPEGVRLRVAGPPVAPGERPAVEAALRTEALRALREAGIPRAGGEPRG